MKRHQEAEKEANKQPSTKAGTPPEEVRRPSGADRVVPIIERFNPEKHSLITLLLSTEDLNRAFDQVVRNKGTAGVDGMTVKDLKAYIQQNWTKM